MQFPFLTDCCSQMEEENGSLDEEEANNQDSPESPAEVSKYYALDKY